MHVRKREKKRKGGEEEKEKESIMKRAKVINSIIESDQLFQKIHFSISFQPPLFLHLDDLITKVP